jgi:RimJ/RimL family protein N-acetyltransferase
VDNLPLKTSRLVVRRFTPDDLDAFVKYRRLPEVAEFQDWDTDFGEVEARRVLATSPETLIDKAGEWTQLAVIESATGPLCGDIAVHFVADQPRTVELGVTLAPTYQSHGLAEEALTSVVSWLFATFELHRVFAHVDERNAAARGLLTRLGFRQEAALRDADWFKEEWTTLCIYGLLRHEWPNSTTSRT